MVVSLCSCQPLSGVCLVNLEVFGILSYTFLHNGWRGGQWSWVMGVEKPIVKEDSWNNQYFWSCLPGGLALVLSPASWEVRVWMPVASGRLYGIKLGTNYNHENHNKAVATTNGSSRKGSYQCLWSQTSTSAPNLQGQKFIVAAANATLFQGRWQAEFPQIQLRYE